MAASSEARPQPGVYEPQRCPGCGQEDVPFVHALVERRRSGMATTVWYGCGYAWDARRQTLTSNPARGCGHLWPLRSVEP